MTALPRQVRIVEVGPRDGLQNESRPVPTDRKLAFIARLVDAGLREIEATSFVNPKAIPQLADADEIYPRLPVAPGVTYSALVPNERGLDRALACGARRIAVFTAASDAFTERNIRMSVDESLRVFETVVGRARNAGATARGYVSTAFVCPYAGEIDPRRVREVSQALVDLGCDEIAVSDTVGRAVPTNVQRVLDEVLAAIDRDRVALHFHNTCGTALANVLAGLHYGITCFDAATGGLGGCPYAPGASGNLATEDLVYFLDRMGIETGVRLDGLLTAAAEISRDIDRPITSHQWTRRPATCKTEQ
ncbi:MAG: hydroxymethylglutaryl-CoA lyase [Phycisphaerae bacterium]|nr:hydroxymethylglutaryl-CoA lyase [Phycisphaerae bacterium]